MAEVTTVEELDALPLGSVVRLAPEDSLRVDLPDGSWEQGAVAEKRPDVAGTPAWFFVGKNLGYRSHQADLLPATVLYRPAALGGGDPVACNCTQDGAHDYGSVGCESGTPQPSTDQTWREAAQIVLAEVKINGEPALEFIDRIVAATPTQPSTVTEAQVELDDGGAWVTVGDRPRYWVGPSALAILDAARLTPAQPEQVTTVEELDALPVGGVILSGVGLSWQKCRDAVGERWYMNGDRHALSAGRLAAKHSEAGKFRFVVLYRPDAVTPEGENR